MLGPACDRDELAIKKSGYVRDSLAFISLSEIDSLSENGEHLFIFYFSVYNKKPLRSNFFFFSGIKNKIIVIANKVVS